MMMMTTIMIIHKYTSSVPREKTIIVRFCVVLYSCRTTFQDHAHSIIQFHCKFHSTGQHRAGGKRPCCTAGLGLYKIDIARNRSGIFFKWSHYLLISEWNPNDAQRIFFSSLSSSYRNNPPTERDGLHLIFIHLVDCCSLSSRLDRWE